MCAWTCMRMCGCACMHPTCNTTCEGTPHTYTYISCLHISSAAPLPREGAWARGRASGWGGGRSRVRDLGHAVHEVGSGVGDLELRTSQRRGGRNEKSKPCRRRRVQLKRWGGCGGRGEGTSTKSLFAFLLMVSQLFLSPFLPVPSVESSKL